MPKCPPTGGVRLQEVSVNGGSTVVQKYFIGNILLLLNTNMIIGLLKSFLHLIYSAKRITLFRPIYTELKTSSSLQLNSEQILSVQGICYKH